jgi:hypothetical protein
MGEAAPTLWQKLWYTRLSDALRFRFDASLDWRRVVAEADLPSALADVVGQVVNRMRLWRREKVDVVNELVAHFQDGLSAGRTPQQLVDSFGDPQQAARLIRRAKKRGRPLAWHVRRWIVWAFAALAGAYVVVAILLFAGRPSIKTDYLAIINERAASVPEEERAWPLYRAALKGMGLVEWNTSPKWVQDAELAPGSPAWTEAKNWLESRGSSLQLVRQAAQRRDLGFPVWGTDESFPAEDRAALWELSDPKPGESDDSAEIQPLEDRSLETTYLPHLGPLRLLARLLLIDARQAASSGDSIAAASDVDALIGLSRHCAETPFNVDLAVANSIQGYAFEAIRRNLTDCPELWTNDQLRDFVHTIAAARIDWRRTFEADRATFADTLQRLYTDDGHGDGRLVLHASSWQKTLDMLDSLNAGPRETCELAGERLAKARLAIITMPATSAFTASRMELTQMHDRLIVRAITAMETPLWKQRSLPPMDADSRADDQGLLGSHRNPLWQYFQTVVALYESKPKYLARSEGQREGVLIGLALELYRREHGEWPRSLGELSPRWLPEVPVDRITGEPLHYVIVDDRVVVYSVGVDRDDDAGRAPSGDEQQPNPSDAKPSLASPNYFDSKPVADAEHDGDWVIWSTVESK